MDMFPFSNGDTEVTYAANEDPRVSLLVLDIPCAILFVNAIMDFHFHLI